MLKLPHNCTHLTCQLSNAQNSPSQAQQYVNRELPDVQAGFRKGRGTRDQIANIRWIMEKARELQKNVYFCFNHYAKAFDCVDHNKLQKIQETQNNQNNLAKGELSWKTHTSRFQIQYEATTQLHSSHTLVNNAQNFPPGFSNT